MALCYPTYLAVRFANSVAFQLNLRHSWSSRCSVPINDQSLCFFTFYLRCDRFYRSIDFVGDSTHRRQSSKLPRRTMESPTPKFASLFDADLPSSGLDVFPHFDGHRNFIEIH